MSAHHIGSPNHILGEVANLSPAFCDFGELGSYIIGLICPLVYTERAFDLISLSTALAIAVCCSGLGDSFGGSPSGLE